MLGDACFMMYSSPLALSTCTVLPSTPFAIDKAAHLTVWRATISLMSSRRRCGLPARPITANILGWLEASSRKVRGWR